MEVNIRWMIRRDMPEVLRIEAAGFDPPWAEEDFIRHLRERNCIGMVAEYDETIVGFMLYELHKTRLELLKLAVHAECRRQGVGQQMVGKLTGKLSSNRRNRIAMEICERNLDGQLFFRSMGFYAFAVVADAYAMQYRHNIAPPPVNFVNRISDYA